MSTSLPRLKLWCAMAIERQTLVLWSPFTFREYMGRFRPPSAPTEFPPVFTMEAWEGKGPHIVTTIDPRNRKQRRAERHR